MGHVYELTPRAGFTTNEHLADIKGITPLRARCQAWHQAGHSCSLYTYGSTYRR